jgi:uncharacterized protein (TIGR02646 family)
MRPVHRGSRPIDPNGKPIQFKEYGHARKALIENMGQYCCYCNQKLPASLAVEHVQPKDPVPHLELEWTNFLLGCTNCNSTKGDKLIDLDNYLWPDIHNTHLAFRYNEDGTIEVEPGLPASIVQKAQNMLDLVGLQKYPNDQSASDRRWKNRKDAYNKAKTALDLFEEADRKGAGMEAAEFVAGWAPDSGFFSIWFKVFEKFPLVKAALIKGFPGTAPDAFDVHMNPIARTNVL